MAKAPAVSVIIVTFNSARYLQRVLDALFLQTFRDFELIIVDNASGDGALEAADIADDVTIIRNSENLGFAVANNIAAREARGRWLALLNPDAFPEPEWLEELVAAATRWDAAMVASLQLNYARPDLLDGAGDVLHISGLAWRGGYLRKRKVAPAEDREVFGPCAAGALYLRKAFESVNGFYEPFFCYYEDVDLAFRLRLMGERCVFAPKAIIHHVGSTASGGRHSAFAVYHGFRNTVWAFAKNMPLKVMAYALPMHILMLISLLALNFSRGTFTPAFRGFKHGIEGLPAAIRARPATQQLRGEFSRLFLSCQPLTPFYRGVKAKPPVLKKRSP